MGNFVPVTRIVEEPTTIFISSELAYLDALKQARDEAATGVLEVATIPQLLRLLKSAKAREEIRGNNLEYADAASVEYHGEFNGDRVYAVAHALGPLNRLPRLESGWNDKDPNGYVPITQKEFNDLMNSQPLIHLDDLKRGETPNGRYVAFFRKDKDALSIHFSGGLDSKEFIDDDIVLLRSGNLENRETLLHMLQGEGFDMFGNYHQDLDRPNFETPVGCPLYLGPSSFGIDVRHTLSPSGRFICVAPERQNMLKKLLENSW